MSHSFLSHAQFSVPGGGSRRYLDSSKGPDEGYYVSRDPAITVDQGGSLEVNKPVTDDPERTERVVKEHWDQTREGALASTPDESKHEVYQGKWVPSRKGAKMTLDVSDRYDDALTAGNEAIAKSQHAIYDAAADDDIPVWNENKTYYRLDGILRAMHRDSQSKD